ncbi:MAG TPA: LacI family DNA-binding transcriptional regulator [Devosia sp.]|nr:LacI family DNA-binding transcriptional regulator [Devosia sp.]
MTNLATARRPVRLKQLAFDLGLSVTTVSRALAGYDDVSKVTRRRVVEAAEACGYLEAKVAGRPRGALQHGAVGMLLPLHGTEIIDPNVTRLVAGLSNGLMRRGRDLLLSTVQPGQDDLTVLRHLVDSRRVDGVVMHRLTQNDPCVRYLTERDFPFVTLGRVLEPHAPHSWFDMDAETGFAEATELLLQLGHTRIAVFGPAEPFSYAALRRHGVERALARVGHSILPQHNVKAPVPDPTAIAHAANRLLLGPERPTAVLGILDKYALAVLAAADQIGLLVPRDLSVIGFGDIPEASASRPQLSTFAQHSRDNGEMLADMIVNLIDDGDAVRTSLVPVDFLPRGSHGPAPRRVRTCGETARAMA